MFWMIVITGLVIWLMASFLVALVVGRMSHRADASRPSLRSRADTVRRYTTSTGAVGGITR